MKCEYENKNPKFLSNNNGGILGGISTGQDLVAKILCQTYKFDCFLQNKSINTKFEED